MKTLVSVIIATKNEEQNLERCLRSIKKQNLQPEIIVVDNFSKDRTVQIARKFTRHVYHVGNERSKQRNFGLKKAKGAYIFFVDADMELQKNVLKESFEKLHNNPKFSGVMIDEEAAGKDLLAKVKMLEKRLTWGEPLIEAPRFFRKKDLIKIGGYDEDLIAGEDWDLAQRTASLGPFIKIASKILHHENKSIWQDIQKKYYYAKHIQKYAQKYPKKFQKQAGIRRFFILFKNPKLIAQNPIEFSALLVLKSIQYFAYSLGIFKTRNK